MLASINIEIQKCQAELNRLIAGQSEPNAVCNKIMAEIKQVFEPTAEIEVELRTLMSNGRLVLRIPKKGRRPPDDASDFLIRFIVKNALSIGALTEEKQRTIAWLIKKAIFMQHFRYTEEKRENGEDIDGNTIWETYSKREPDEVFILQDAPPPPQPDIQLRHGRNDELIQRFDEIIASKTVTPQCDLGPDIEQFAEQLRISASNDIQYCRDNRLFMYLLNSYCIGNVFAERLGCNQPNDPRLFLLSGFLRYETLGTRDLLARLERTRFDCSEMSIWRI